eukprot:3195367-Lingulodinium_polyedra.AAC.1
MVLGPTGWNSAVAPASSTRLLLLARPLGPGNATNAARPRPPADCPSPTPAYPTITTNRNIRITQWPPRPTPILH